MGLRSESGFIGYPWKDEGGRALQFTYLFVVGRGPDEDDVSRYVFEREKAKHKDILDVPLYSSQEGTDKMLWALQEVTKLYHFEYLIKVEDTTLVNIRYMFEWLQDRRFSYGGACVEGVELEVPESVPTSVYLPDDFPTYAHTSLITLSWDMLGCLNAYVESGSRRIFQIEDAFLGTLVADLDVEITCIPGAFAGKAEAYCMGGTAISLQNVTAQTAAQMLTNWRRTGSYCPRYIHS